MCGQWGRGGGAGEREKASLDFTPQPTAGLGLLGCPNLPSGEMEWKGRDSFSRENRGRGSK